MDSTKQQGRTIVERLSKQSLAGELTFPEVVVGLSAAGVGSYLVDYRAGQTTYYFRSDEALGSALDLPRSDIAQAFDSAALQKAIGRAQRDEIRYPEFVRQSRAAGCVGYFVWIDGRQASYMGRNGELHIERFPGSN